MTQEIKKSTETRSQRHRRRAREEEAVVRQLLADLEARGLLLSMLDGEEEVDLIRTYLSRNIKVPTLAAKKALSELLTPTV